MIYIQILTSRTRCQLYRRSNYDASALLLQGRHIGKT